MKLILTTIVLVSLSHTTLACSDVFIEDVRTIFKELSLPNIVVTASVGDEPLQCDFSLQSKSSSDVAEVSTEHLFWVASVTKPFTSYLSIKTFSDLNEQKNQKKLNGTGQYPLYELLSQTSERVNT